MVPTSHAAAFGPELTMAERGGFEPPVACDHTAFRERHLKPLGHLSAAEYTEAFELASDPSGARPRPGQGPGTIPPERSPSLVEGADLESR
jgi:hypothetical protein